MRRLTLLVVTVAAACLLSSVAISRAGSPVVTPVQGPSNFHRLGMDFESSDMGRTGVWGPPPDGYVGPPVNFTSTQSITRTVLVSGADMYRLSCRPCHKADGNGTPPEIPSISGPVQGMSATLMERRMADRGHPIAPALARELAAGSRKDFLDRLKNGGQKMPAFGYLTASEINALIGYLDVLAAVPAVEKTSAVTEPAARVGELLVKGTCHICHDANGTWPDPEELLEGSTPPISGFTAQKTMPDFVWKVRFGAPIFMGRLPFLYRGRMPVFDYVSEDEVASAYLYLMAYPPQKSPQD